MATFAIPNRPFAIEPITGMMTPDGLFEVALGRQDINVHIQSASGTAANVQLYIESVSDPGIVVTPTTHALASAVDGVPHLFAWRADFTAASPGKHLVSFIAEADDGTRQRIIKKIFVTKIAFDPASGGYNITSPEGVLGVVITSMMGPENARCGKCNSQEDSCIDGSCRIRKDVRDVLRTAATLAQDDKQAGNLLHYLSQGSKIHNPDFVLCMPEVLLSELEAVIRPTPPFAGQYGDLPFQDPWWKVLLVILAVILLVAAVIAEAVDGTGSITVGAGGSGGTTSSGGTCCWPFVSGGGTSPIAAGLLAAAAAAAGLAGYTDERDLFRKGQDNTMPATDSELTIGETMKSKFIYDDDIVPGKPFKVGVEYTYTRQTTEQTYTHEAREVNANVHLLDRYVIDASDVVRAYRREAFVVKAQFYQTADQRYTGSQLLVQCFLVGPAGQERKFVLQDNGMHSDATSSDGTYTGSFQFTTKDKGIWKFFVIAQDVNTADPNLEPEEAAQIIGGMLLTNQLSITFNGGMCPLVADGDVNVIG